MSALRAGDWVEVRSKEEILATLDEHGRLQNMCFMPEMLDQCGKRLRVAKRAHKTCDTIWFSGGRRVESAVHLEGVRCSGAAHGGCEAGCLIFWKEAWLKPASDSGPRADDTRAPKASAPPSTSRRGCTEQDVWDATLSNPSTADERVYSCQATRLLEATSPLPWWDMRQYWEDYRSRNVDTRTFVCGAAYSLSSQVVGVARRLGAALGLDLTTPVVRLYDAMQRVVGGRAFPRKTGRVPAGQRTPSCGLSLQAGDLVRVKSHEAILETLDRENKNRGLYFDAEHVPYCGGTYRVQSLVRQIIDEKTGKMLRFKTPSIVLAGVCCQARYSHDRMFCPRAVYSYWRDIWLERPDEARQDADSPAHRPEPA